MKITLLLFLLSHTSLYASGPEIFNAEDGKQIVSNIKDIEIQELLEKTREFDECRKMNQFDSSDNDTRRDEKIKKAQECFRAKLKDSKKVKELSEILSLQQFGLVKGKDIKEIQTYLDNKMYKSMTGVDLEETDKKKFIDSLKFKNKKHIDQSIFISLYKTQLSKNALFEISRFCFENFRIAGVTAKNTSFGEYWSDFETKKEDFKRDSGASLVTDTGSAEDFGSFSDPKDKDKIYQDIFKSINVGNEKSFKKENLKDFFMICGNYINPLCNGFKDNIKPLEAKSEVGDAKNATPTSGAAACLTRSRLQEIKKAIVDAREIEKQFNEMAVDPDYLAGLLKGQPAKIFIPGKDGEDTTLDNLTNFTSQDVLEGGKGRNALAQKRIDDCKGKPELPECESFFLKEEDLSKMKSKIETEMTFRREVEMERIRQLKNENDKVKLEEYLNQNGFFDLAKKAESMNVDELVKEVGVEFEAKKKATLEEINKRLGHRQISKDPKQAEQDKLDSQVIQKTQEERARLAQVVLFNNIITSHLELTRKEDKSFAGRNVNAWKKEERDLKTAQIDQELFTNLKATDDGSSNRLGNEEFAGDEFIDTFLGK
jgi:hypothetical protein